MNGRARLSLLAAALTGLSPMVTAPSSAIANDHPEYGPESYILAPFNNDELAEADIQDLDSDLIFALRLHLLRGHLAAAKVLASYDRYNEAHSHIVQALRSTLIPIEAELKRRGLPSLRERLLAVDAVSDGNAGQLALLHEMRIAEMQIWAAYDSISEERRQAVAFNLDLALLLFKQSARQYEAAWRGVRLVHLHEFQNGYGFLLEARWLLARSLPVLRKRNVKAATNIENAYLRLREAWPSIDPPAKPVLPYSTINGLVAAIEINANRL